MGKESKEWIYECVCVCVCVQQMILFAVQQKLTILLINYTVIIINL